MEATRVCWLESIRGFKTKDSVGRKYGENVQNPEDKEEKIFNDYYFNQKSFFRDRLAL